MCVCVQMWLCICPPACESVSSLARSWESYIIYCLFVRRIIAFWSLQSIFSFKHTHLSSNLRPVAKARTLNLWASLCLWELSQHSQSQKKTSTAPARLRWRWDALFYGIICLVCLRPNPIFTACLYIPAANGLHTEAGSRPKSAGSSVQLGQGGNLVISLLYLRLMNLKLR